MFRRMIDLLLVTFLTALISFSTSAVFAQKNQNSAKGEMKESGKEVGRAGKSVGHNVVHGHPVRAGKHFGKHIGRSGKDFGKGTKHAVHHVVHRNKNQH